jgi:hypothetical protein
MNNNKTKVEGVKPSSTKKRITSQEEQDWWDALYMYIKNDILELDPKLHLNHYTILRLRGMAQGCFIGQKRDQCDLTYGYRVILAAFSKMAPLIKYGFQTRTFNNLQHKINWMMSVIEPHLNDIYIEEESERKRIEDLQKQTNNVNEDIERYQNTNNYINSQVEFKTAKTWDKEHEDMW